MTTLHLSHTKNEKCGFKKMPKYGQKIFKKKHPQMKNLLMKCI
jgi:hypothetical protein